MTIAILIKLVAGLVLLVIGADLLVWGASRIAIQFGLSSLVVGLTIVAFGTSSPELAVALYSSFSDKADIAVGNVVGSNIFNILLILGISALIAPMTVARQLLRLDVPIMIGTSILTFVFGLDGTISRVDGIILFLGAVIYTTFLMRQSSRQNSLEDSEDDSDEDLPSKHENSRGWFLDIGAIVVGTVMLVVGSNLLVRGAIAIAKVLGISELVIGLTIVATGTSLPELASSVMASIRGKRDISVGNVVGSNIFNLLVVLGLTAAISPTGIQISPAALYFDMPLMIAVAIACLPIFLTGRKISRWEGMFFLSYYAAYTTYLILNATNNPHLSAFNKVMVVLVIPVSVIMLIVSIWHGLRFRSHHH